MLMNPFQRRDNPHSLVVGMTGVKMGDRFVQVGCAHGGRLGAVAGKAGLSGRAVAVVPDESSAARAQKGAADAGALVEIETSPPTRLPLDAVAFDVALVDDTGGLLTGMRDDERARAFGEIHRVLRPGGRVVVVGATSATGLAALLGRGASAPPFDALPALTSAGFRSVRTLAEREGLIFVEGIKPR